MLVKHNLYEKPQLQMPRVANDVEDIRLEDGHLTIIGLYGILTQLVEGETRLGDESLTYTVGFRGNYTGDVRLYKPNAYRKPTSKGDIHYRTDVNAQSLLHIRAFTMSDINIKSIFLTDAEPDIVIPNKKDFSDDIQAYYPPEGDYKEIEPVRG